MIVIKLGGSLAASGYLQACLAKIENDYCHQNVIIVPGGGVFADHVRQTQLQWGFDNATAHHLAILAMQQMAMVFKALKPNFRIVGSIIDSRNQTKGKGIAIWSPAIAELDKAEIPATWDITSDSLAAWVAKTLNADKLILIKSVNIEPNFDVQKLVAQQIVDASFCQFLSESTFQLNIVYAKDFLSQS